MKTKLVVRARGGSLGFWVVDTQRYLGLFLKPLMIVLVKDLASGKRKTFFVEMTFSKMTFGKTTFGKMTLSLMIFSIMTFS